MAKMLAVVAVVAALVASVEQSGGAERPAAGSTSSGMVAAAPAPGAPVPSGAEASADRDFDPSAPQQ